MGVIVIPAEAGIQVLLRQVLGLLFRANAGAFEIFCLGGRFCQYGWAAKKPLVLSMML